MLENSKLKVLNFFMNEGYPQEVGMNVMVELIEAMSFARPAINPVVLVTLTTLVIVLLAVT